VIKKETIRMCMSMALVTALLVAMMPAQAQLLYTVQGYVYYADGGAPVENGVSVTVTDLDTSAVRSTTTLYGIGFYSVIFGFPATDPVTAGDLLRIEAVRPCFSTTTTVTAAGGPVQEVNLVLQGDTDAPVLSGLKPAAGSCIASSTPEICANYSDISGINISSVRITVDSIDVTGNAMVTATGVCYTPAIGLAEGEHTVMVNASDPCDHQNSTNWAFTVDTVEPTVAFIAPTPANNTEVSVDHVTVAVTVTEEGCGIDTVNLIWNGTVWVEQPPGGFNLFMIADTQFSFDVTGLENGEYSYFVQASDMGGNVGQTETRMITVTKQDYNFTIAFLTGYNLISIPVNDTGVANASALMNKAGAQEVFKWDKSAQAWVAYNALMPPAAAFSIRGGEGYYLRMNSPVTAKFSGTGWESPFNVSLVTGYNLIGVPVNDASITNASTLMNEAGAQEVFKWDKSAQAWVAYNALMPPAAAFSIGGGEGYYLRMCGNAIVTFEGGPWQN